MKSTIEHKKNDLEYFEEEMAYLINRGGEFSKKFPSAASNLKLDQEGSSDPHVQQILESFAFLSSSLQKQVDENTSVLSRFLIETLYPNAVMPIPSTSIVEICINSSNPAIQSGMTIPRGTDLVYDSDHDVSYKFKTVYDTFLFPGEITQFGVEKSLQHEFIADKNKKLLTIGIELASSNLKNTDINKIRFYINAGKTIANRIYDIIFNECEEVIIYSSEKNYYKISKEKILKVGFGKDESLVYIPDKTHNVSRIFQEFFILPEKFLYFDIEGIDFKQVEQKFSIIFVCKQFSDISLNITQDSLKLRSTPIINLFPILSEPVKTDIFKNEYKLYTNFLKSKFVFYHSIKKLNYINENSESFEIKSILENLFPSEHALENNSYYYNLKPDKTDLNCFKITLYNNLGEIFINEITIYADVFATNGIFCEKLSIGTKIRSALELPINHCVMLKSATNYVTNINSGDYLLNAMSSLFSEKMSFYDESKLLVDLKSLISFNLDNIIERNKVLNILDSMESITIHKKPFSLANDEFHFFVRGKEINLTMDTNMISNESISMLSEVIFDLLKNVSAINSCVSLNVIEKSTQRIIYSCTESKGIKSYL